MTEQIKFIDLFAGIGGFRIAFDGAGAKCVFSSEIDKFARHTYSANYLNETIHWRDSEKYKEHPELHGDIRLIDKEDIPDFDILAAGFPCPTFSLAGVSKRNSLGMKHGFDDQEKGQLFFQIIEILKVKKPSAFLLENVKNLVSHNKGQTFKIVKQELEELGYTISYDIFDAAKLVPQHRERILIAGFKSNLNVDFDLKKINIPDRKPKLENILTPSEEVDEKYTISHKLWNYLQKYREKHRKKGNGFGYSLAKLDDVSRTMSARYYKDGSEILIDQKHLGKNPRMLTEWEAASLFGFPKEYRKVYGREFKIPVSRTQAYKQFGNSVCVPLVSIIAKKMVEALHIATKGKNNRKQEAS